MIKIDSAVAALRSAHAWKKTSLGVGFLWTYLSVLRHAYTAHILKTILTLSGSYEVFLQPLVSFGGRDEIAPTLGVISLPPQKKAPFWGRE